MIETVQSSGGGDQSLFSPEEREKYDLYVKVLSDWPDVDFGAAHLAINDPFALCNDTVLDTRTSTVQQVRFIDRGLHWLDFNKADVPSAVRADLHRLLAMPRVVWGEDNS
jgi:hypothetical protein